MSLETQNVSPRLVIVEYGDGNELHRRRHRKPVDADTIKSDAQRGGSAVAPAIGAAAADDSLQALRDRVLDDIVLEKLARETGASYHSTLGDADATLVRELKRTLMREIRAGRSLRKGERKHRRRHLSRDELARRVRDEVLADVKRGHKHRLRRTEHGHKHSRRPKHFGLDDAGNVVTIHVKPDSRAAADVDALRRKEAELARREHELAARELQIQKTADMREREAKLLQRKQELEERQRKLAERSQKLLAEQSSVKSEK